MAATALGLRDGDRVYEVRRVRLGNGRPMVLEHSVFPAATFPGLLQCRLDGSLYELLETRYGQRPHRARESLEPVIAGVREAEALEVAEGAPLMLVERVAYNRAGQPDRASTHGSREMASYVMNASELGRQRRINRQLQQALDSRIIIERAKGVLAAELGVSVDKAFDLMRRHARSRHANLLAVARAVVHLGLRPGS